LARDIREVFKMKRPFTAPAPLYTFLSYCNDSPLDKEVLDCGAGGSSPPLSLFLEYGYKTHGIDISDRQLKKTARFCEDHGMELDIAKGDMRNLPFATESMSFVYSYASICHMTKSDVAVAMQEIIRVLKKEGLCFISFCAVPDRNLCETEHDQPGEYPYEEDGETGVHSIFGDNEPDRYFYAFTFLQKEKRQIAHYEKQKPHGWAELLYFARKR
jgi:ubiquinone/menaquinone biosynthesis C-methylase UbiE